MTDPKHNQPPDVVLNLSNEQATFLLENMLANTRLCLGLIMSMADENVPIEVKQVRADKIVKMQDKYRDIMRLLRAAGAREPEEKEPGG